MTPAQLDASSAPIVMIHYVDEHQLLLTTSSEAVAKSVFTALLNYAAAQDPPFRIFDPAKKVDRIVTVGFASSSLTKKKAIKLLGSILNDAGFQPVLPGHGNRTWQPL